MSKTRIYTEANLSDLSFPELVSWNQSLSEEHARVAREVARRSGYHPRTQYAAEPRSKAPGYGWWYAAMGFSVGVAAAIVLGTTLGW